MKLRAILPCLSIAMGLAAFGCGGGSSSSSGNGGGGGGIGKGVAAFAGSYVGAFADSGPDTDTGEIAVNVSSSGVITARAIDVTAGATLTQDGQVTFVSSTATTKTGSFDFTDTNGGVESAIGNLTLNVSTGTLTGSIYNKTNGQTHNFASGLVSTAGKNSFAGFYNGTATYNGAAGSPANTVAMIIDGNGNVTGLLGVNVAGETDNSGVALGVIASNTGVITIGQSMTGTLTLKNGVLSGTVAGGTNNQNQPQTLVITLKANT